MSPITRHVYPVRQTPAMDRELSSLRMVSIRAEYDRLAAAVQAGNATGVQTRRLEVLRATLNLTSPKETRL